MNEIKGNSVQNGIPTPDNPVEIKSINIFKVNDIQYRDNIPSNRLIGITKEQYCEYEQLQQENKQLKEKIIILQASEPMLELTKYYCERDKYKSIVEELKEKFNKVKLFTGIDIVETIKELEEGKEND